MPSESPSPYDQRDRIDKEILARLQEIGDKLPPNLRIGLDPISLMIDSSGHPNRETAIRLLRQCIDRANDWHLPIDLIEFGLEKALVWRSILFPDSPSSISIEDLESI